MTELSPVRGLLAVVLWSLAVLAHAQALVLDTDKQEIHLGEYLRVWQAPANADDLRHAQGLPDAQWTRINRTNVNLFYTPAPHWFHVALRSGSHASTWALQLDSPFLDDVQFYLLDSENHFISRHLVGDTRKFSMRPVEDAQFLLPFSLNAEQEYHLYLRVQTRSLFLFTPVLRSEKQMQVHLLRSNTLYGAFFGIVGFMLIYNFIFFISTREKVYLSYVGFLGAYSLYQLAITGFGYQYLWPDNIVLQSRIYGISSGLGYLLGAVFMIIFLRLRERHAILSRIGNGILCAWTIMIMASLFADEVLIRYFTFPLQLISMLFGLSAGAYLWWKGYKVAGYFTLAWSCLVLGTLCFVLVQIDVLAPNTFTLHGTQWGGIIQMTLLSFSLAEMVREQRNEMDLTKKTNEILEREVESRTLSLNERNQELLELQKQMMVQEKMAALGVLSAGIAHEINNPANFLRAGAENLRNSIDEFNRYLTQMLTDEADAAIREAFAKRFQLLFDQLAIIDDGSRRICDIVVNMRSAIRRDSGVLRRVDLSQGLHSTVALVALNFKTTVSFQCDVPTDLWLICNQARLNQVFMNLLVNACQAIEEKQAKTGDNTPGKVIITASVTDEMITIRITDSGCGMSDEVKQHLFERLFTTKDSNKGTGLGLFISRDIVLQHRGRLTYESTLGQGTTAIVCLPCKESDET